MPALLAGLDAEVIAIGFLFVVLVAVLIVRPLLVALFANAPFIGPWLSSNIDSGLANFERAMQGPAAGALGVLSSTIDWLAYEWTQLLSTLSGLATLAMTAIWKVTHLVIPAAEQAAHDFAASSLASAEAALRTDIGAAEQAAAHGLAAAQALDAQLIGAAASEAVSLAQQSEALARGLFAVAEADAAALIEQERAFVVGQVLGVEGDIQAAFNRAAALTAAAEAALQGDISSVERQLLGQVQTEVDSLLKLIQADKEALSAALTGSLAGVIADVAIIKALDCLKFCSPLAQVGSFLQGLDAAVLVGFVAYARQHPKEASSFMTAELLPAIKSVGAGVEALIGG